MYVVQNALEFPLRITCSTQSALLLLLFLLVAAIWNSFLKSHDAERLKGEREIERERAHCSYVHVLHKSSCRSTHFSLTVSTTPVSHCCTRKRFNQSKQFNGMSFYFERTNKRLNVVHLSLHQWRQIVHSARCTHTHIRWLRQWWEQCGIRKRSIELKFH